MFETSQIFLSRKALQNNLTFIRKQLKNKTRLCSVIKGNAYGHGLSEYAKLAMSEGVDCFGVYSAEEAYQLKNELTQIPDIFIMGSMEDDAVSWAVEHEIEFAVFDFQRLELALEMAKKHKKKAKVHLEIETGMRRTGFDFTFITELCTFLKLNAKHIIFQGLFTHLAGAESQANHFRVSNQITNFSLSLDLFKIEGQVPVYHHTGCSAALLNYPDAPGNMIRIGILQYGYWPNKETQIRFMEEKKLSGQILKRIISWKSRIMSINNVKKGSFVGYGTTFLTYKNMKLAVVPVGYAHGYSRILSNTGSVLIDGKIAPVVGIVNMNSLTVDVTHIKNVQNNDEVVLIGFQGRKEITVNSFSEQSQQLNYELLTRLPMNIPRTIN